LALVARASVAGLQCPGKPGAAVLWRPCNGPRTAAVTPAPAEFVHDPTSEPRMHSALATGRGLPLP
jgi:hypothetical protein